MEVSQMRKQQYIATVACLVAGVIGFVSVYATDKGKERREAEQEIAAQHDIRGTKIIRHLKITDFILILFAELRLHNTVVLRKKFAGFARITVTCFGIFPVFFVYK